MSSCRYCDQTDDTGIGLCRACLMKDDVTGQAVTYRWRTDTASGTVEAVDAPDALRQLIMRREWPERDASVIRDGGWLWIRSDYADDDIRRGGPENDGAFG